MTIKEKYFKNIVKEYSLLHSIFDIIEDEKNIKIYLGKDDNNRVQTLTIHSISNTKITGYVISAIANSKLLNYNLYINSNLSTVEKNNIYQSQSINKSLEEINNFIRKYDNSNKYKSIYYNDAEYMNELLNGLDYLTDQNRSMIRFYNNEKDISIIIDKYYSIKSKSIIHKVSFINSDRKNVYSILFYDKTHNRIIDGYNIVKRENDYKIDNNIVNTILGIRNNGFEE